MANHNSKMKKNILSLLLAILLFLSHFLYLDKRKLIKFEVRLTSMVFLSLTVKSNLSTIFFF